MHDHHVSRQTATALTAAENSCATPDPDSTWNDANIRDWWTQVHRYIRFQLWRSNDAEDLTQTTFMIAWRKRDEIPDLHPAWLKAVAFNEVRNYWRATRTYHAWHIFDEGETAARTPARNDAVSAALARIQIEQIFTFLSETDIGALRLRYLQDLPHREAAEILGISSHVWHKRVRLALARARRIAATLDIMAAPGTSVPVPAEDITAAPPPPSAVSRSVEMRMLLADGYAPAVQFVQAQAGIR